MKYKIYKFYDKMENEFHEQEAEYSEIGMYEAQDLIAEDILTEKYPFGVNEDHYGIMIKDIGNDLEYVPDYIVEVKKGIKEYLVKEQENLTSLDIKELKEHLKVLDTENASEQDLKNAFKYYIDLD